MFYIGKFTKFMFGTLFYGPAMCASYHAVIMRNCSHEIVETRFSHLLLRSNGCPERVKTQKPPYVCNARTKRGSRGAVERWFRLPGAAGADPGHPRHAPPGPILPGHSHLAWSMHHRPWSHGMDRWNTRIRCAARTVFTPDSKQNSIRKRLSMASDHATRGHAPTTVTHDDTPRARELTLRR